MAIGLGLPPIPGTPVSVPDTPGGAFNESYIVHLGVDAVPGAMRGLLQYRPYNHAADRLAPSGTPGGLDITVDLLALARQSPVVAQWLALSVGLGVILRAKHDAEVALAAANALPDDDPAKAQAVADAQAVLDAVLEQLGLQS